MRGSFCSEREMDRKMVCLVCQKPASGLQYGVFACRGCKEFYARAVSKKLDFLCVSGDGRCSTASTVRPRCRACRLETCIRLGMKIRTPRKQPRQKQKKPIDDEQSDAEPDLPDICGYAESSGYDSSVEDGYVTGSGPSSSSEQSDRFSDAHRSHTLTPDEECPVEELPVPVSSAMTPYSEDFWWSKFAPFEADSAGKLDLNQRQLIQTANAVGAAVDLIFSDQIHAWTGYRVQALTNGQPVNQPETSIDNILSAINYHASDMIGRVERFVSVLPGMKDLNPEARKSLTVGWKWLVLPLMHMSVCMTEQEMYMTIGPKQYHYCRYWQDMISQKPFTNFVYKFVSYVNRIGLSELERFLLMAVIMFEPAQPGGKNYCADHSLQISVIHRHYTDVLFDHIQRRCSNSTELQAVCRNLERFLGVLKIARKVHAHYYWNPENTPSDTMEGRARVRVIQLKEMKIAQQTNLTAMQLDAGF